MFLFPDRLTMLGGHACRLGQEPLRCGPLDGGPLDGGPIRSGSLRRAVRLSLLVTPAWLLAFLTGVGAESWAQPAASAAAASPPPTAAEVDPQAESRWMSRVRQLTFTGKRAGEGYFQKDGQRIVFQSERDESNPFFQIFLLDLASGQTDRISPGIGKTTCAWIHPDQQQVLFASTHADPLAEKKQRDELELRAKGEQKRYAWDYDEHYDLFVKNLSTGELRQLTHELGYDAEASYSPEGDCVVFASNRRAYRDDVSAAEVARRTEDPAYFMELYRLDLHDGQVQPLTDTPGYDGGPFFSPDGRRIGWRRFSENGALAEIYTMQRDGTDARQITRLGAMSWAPFYHPSGQYLIFTTNLHGFSNFELYVVDTEGKSAPVRVTSQEGFDALPSFSPDGRQLLWTSQRNPLRQSQLYVAEWNHAWALQQLGLADQAAPTTTAPSAPKDDATAPEVAARAFQAAKPEYAAVDLMRHVDYLCRPELGGRLTGTPGELRATEYVAAYFDHLGLQPAGDNGGWYQAFTFTSGVSLGEGNRLHRGGIDWKPDQDWRPLAFSSGGQIDAAEVVFAGYGIVAPSEENQAEYDSFVHLEVKDRWVLVLRDMPQEIDDARRQHLSRYSTLRYKAMQLRDRGARGMIVVNGPHSNFRQPLVPLQFDGSQSSSSLPVISLRTEIATAWLAAANHDLATLQATLDQGTPQVGFALPGGALSATIDIRQEKRTGRNVLGRLPASEPHPETVIVGAHIDHLGSGANASSLASDDEQNGIHYGADDNASGVAGMLEIAEAICRRQEPRRRDLLFAAWSGEELGLLGSGHFVKSWSGHTPDMYPQIAACLNLDMIGRFQDKLVLQGINSSSDWPSLIERCNVVVGLPVTLQNDSYLPTDASSFYVRSVPILSAFTGNHRDYHTPRDTPDRLDYEMAARIAELVGRITWEVAASSAPPKFIAPQKGAPEARTGRLRAFLGTVPDYAETDQPGVKLSGVAKGGPAEQAGVRAGDTIIELAGKKVENIYDYTFAIEALKIGRPTTLRVKRGDQVLELQVTPQSRE